jgi:putative nucleotidyltransferase with HDIG domain
MGRINVDHVEPGMVLASDLIHSNGRFLLGKGVILDPSRLRILKIWGVQSVEVEGSSDEMKSLQEDRIDPSILQSAEDWTKRRFSKSNLDHPFIQELFDICALRKAREIIQTPEGMEPSVDAEPARQSDLNVTPACSMGPIDLNGLVDEELDLASLPTIFMEISEAIGDPRSSSVHIANVISKDTSLSAKLLKIVNSAFYNFPYKVDTISRAVTIIGSRQLSSLAMGASVLRSFQGIPEDLVDMESFWKHSIACGISARMIASFKNIPNTERLFVAGLLHDIGRIILYQSLPDQMSRILLQAKQTHRFLRTIEAEVLGVDHAHVGGMLLKKWKFPLAMEQAVAFHHDPLKSPHLLEASILYLSDILVNALEMGTSGDCLAPPLIPEVWNSLGLEKELFTKIVQLIERQVEEIIHHFFDQKQV